MKIRFLFLFFSCCFSATAWASGTVPKLDAVVKYKMYFMTPVSSQDQACLNYVNSKTVLDSIYTGGSAGPVLTVYNMTSHSTEVIGNCQWDHEIISHYPPYINQHLHEIGGEVTAFEVVGVCPSNSMELNSTTCSCLSGFVPATDGKSCISDCPHTYLGIETSRGWALTFSSTSVPPVGCDSFGCNVNQALVSSALGMSLYSINAAGSQCPNSNQPNNPPATVMTVSFSNSDNSKLTEMQAAQAAADKIAEAKTAALAEASAAAATAAEAATAKLADDALAAVQATAALAVAKTAVQNAAIAFQNSPTAATLAAYNNAVAGYNAAQGAATAALTAAQSSWDTAVSTDQNLRDINGPAATQNDALNELKAVLDSTSIAFDQSLVSDKMTSAVPLDSAVSAATAADAAATAAISDAQTTITNTTTIINNTNNTVTTTTITVTNIAAGMPDLAATPINTPDAPPAPPAPAPTPPAKELDTSGLNKEVTQGGIRAALQEFLNLFKSNRAEDVAALAERDTSNLEIPKSTEAVTFTPVLFASSAVCPADIPLNIMGRTFAISYSEMCDVMNSMRPLFLAFGAISAVFIFIGGLRT